MIILHNSLINNNTPSFKSARINILATADNHGCIETIPRLIETVRANKGKIFYKHKDKSSLNIFAVAGDYYISPDNIGLKTRKNDSIGDVQHDFLLKTISVFKSMLNKDSKFDTVFTLGNHDLDAGASWILNKLKDAPVVSLFSNVKPTKSPLLSKLMETHDNFVYSKIYEVPDDKNSDIVNHVLFLGITIPRIQFSGKALEGIEFYNNTPKSQPTDLLATYDKLSRKIKQYKKQHPNGAVVLLSHMGSKLSSNIAEKVKGINLILNGHDHLASDLLINNTVISCLGANNDFVKSLILKFNNNGKLSNIMIKRYDTNIYQERVSNNKDLQKFVKDNIEDDATQIIDLTEYKKSIDDLKHTKFIREDDKPYVNYTTTAVKEALKTYYPKIDAVAIPSSVLRGGIAPLEKDRYIFNNFDLIKLFGGNNKNNAQLRMGEITGKELLKIVERDLCQNIQDVSLHGIMHWSDLRINRTLFNQILNGKSSKSIYDAVEIRNPDTKIYEPVNIEKTYNVVVSDKFILKEIEQPFLKDLLQTKFYPIKETFTMLFEEFLKNEKYCLKFTDEIKEKRIL